jgi:error-prone DNA polymerase
MGYVELHCHSAYSFLDGASLPEELAARAAELGYEALALTDHDGVYGSLEFAHAAKHLWVRPITGAEVTLADGAHVTLLVESSRGYANLCHILTEAHAGTRRPGREEREPLPPAVEQAIVEEHADGLVCLSGCARRGLAVHDPNAAARLAGAFGRDHFFIELQRPFERGDARRTTALRDLAEHLGVDTIVTGNVHAHAPRRTLLQDALVAIRCRTSLDGCEQERRGNRESVLRSPEEMNAGTLTMRPVSIFAGLPTFETEAPLMAGSVSITVMSTVWGSSMPTGRSSNISILSFMFDIR